MQGKGRAPVVLSRGSYPEWSGLIRIDRGRPGIDDRPSEIEVGSKGTGVTGPEHAPSAKTSSDGRGPCSRVTLGVVPRASDHAVDPDGKR